MIKIPVSEPCLSKEELENVTKAVKSSWISSKGEFINKFEENFAHYCGTGYGVSTSNGTTALHLALKAIGVSQGDEVIIPTLTFVSTASTVKFCNATPVFVDSHPDYWCIDPRRIEDKITDRTKAIVPVHLYGHPCDMDVIMDIASDYNLYVVEDAAEAHGAEYKSKKVGGVGHIGCFSFYGNKIITTGEGGMCVTNDKDLAEKMSLLKNHGMNPDKRYWHDIVGFNYRMTNLQAAIGVAQLKKIDEFIKVKRKNAELYNRLLNDINGLILPPEMPWAKNVYWMYSVLIDAKFGFDIKKIQEKLLKKGIDTRPLFYPIHTMPPYKSNKDNKGFPISEKLSKIGISLPSSVTLKKKDINFICNSLRSVFNRRDNY